MFKQSVSNCSLSIGVIVKNRTECAGLTYSARLPVMDEHAPRGALLLIQFASTRPVLGPFPTALLLSWLGRTLNHDQFVKNPVLSDLTKHHMLNTYSQTEYPHPTGAILWQE
ncbi:MAG: hypothetical protein CM1200mP41_11760 [Gammaproteobacteria bacterium]|nr:MAG: hypothetical protein CM1200mP41_11760 [Gammaproteobacteria bacterium]